MDGRAGHFQRRSTRKPALQLRPQPRFIQPPQNPVAGNRIRPFTRPGGVARPGIPGPSPLGGGALGAQLMRIPGLGKAGLAFGLGFFIGDALINPLLGRKPTINWPWLNNPDTRFPDAQDPLPPELTVELTGEMGAEGAFVTSTNRATTSRQTGNDGSCQPGAPIDQESGQVAITATGGQLRYREDSPGACGSLAGAGLSVLRTAPAPGGESDFEDLGGFTSGNFRPPGSIVSASFAVNFVPRGEPQGFLPEPLWVPTQPPAPEVEPEPELEPEPEPRRRPLAPPPVPLAPPDPVPLPQPEVDPNPRPVPEPGTNPAPTTSPRRVPRPAPLRVPTGLPGAAPSPTTSTPLTNAGTQAPARPAPIVPTNPRDRFPVPGGRSVTTPGPRPTPRDMALELGRIENKVDALLNTETTWSPNWLTLLWAALQALEPLLDWLEQEDGWPSTSYTLEEDCGDVPEGEQPESRTIITPGAEHLGEFLTGQFNAMAELTQAHLQLRQPICRRRVEPEGQRVTVSFESDEVGLGGRAPLRKYLRYRCRPGTTLESLADHWRDFTWQAGSVISIHTGAPWGRLQVWAASEDEGRRVIRHAGETSGVDPDSDGEWLTTGTDHARYGQAGTMRVVRRHGFLKVTTRDSPNGLPLVSD